MQHLDEGTIHSWLDGALTPDEAARVEAHVAECASCAAAVAEARGFIAASSRILTALDNAPRGVIPVAAPRRRVDPMVWRIAATLLVVAGGTLVVVRNRGVDEQLRSAGKESITFTSESTRAAQRVPTETAPAAASANQALPQPARREALGTAKSGVIAQRVPAEGGQTGRAPELLKARVSSPQTSPPSAPSQPQTFAPSPLSEAVGMDAAAQNPTLKVVGSPRRIGAKVTLYEVASGDTVTLTETVSLRLESVVVTGATSGAAPTAQNAKERSAAAPATSRADLSAKAAPESRAAIGAASAPPPAVTDTAVHTIAWTDPTGTRLSLTGRMPEARLQEIRIRIERERAAAAAAKKNP